MPDDTSYAIKELTSADVSLLRSMLDMFGAAFDNPDSYHRRQPSDSYLHSLLAKKHFIAIVALNGAQVVGGITAYELDKFEQERREIYIYDLAVLEAHRRKRIATRMILELKCIARRRGAYVIFVQADLEDAPAIALYRSLGRQETAHHFDIDVR